MRRSICYCEPSFALAGDIANWKFVYTSATALPRGTKLRFDLQSKGRPMDWQIPQVNLREKTNLIWGEMGEKKPIAAETLEIPGIFEFTLPSELKSGERFFIFIGTPDAEIKTKGNASQKTIQRRRAFYLYVDVKQKGEPKEPEIFQLDVRGNELETLRIIAPSLVARNKRFDVIVRFEDVFGNLTSNAPDETLIDLSYEHLRENLNWKLFVPETGFISLPNLYFNEPGIYRIQLRNLQSGELFYSSPIKCLADSAIHLYWGQLHGESERFDSAESIESFLRHARDEKALQFIATSCFDSEEETSNEIWKSISQCVSEFNEEDRFVAILGLQWLGIPKEEGLRQFLYTKDNKPILRNKDTKHNSLRKIYKTHNSKDLISIPSFTMGKSTHFNFKDFNPEFERVVEIYNAWGSSEHSAKEGNIYPIQGGRAGIGETSEGSIQKALSEGRRFGFVAGGYDDRGPYSHLYDAAQSQYSAGLTAILAKEHTRSSLLDALYNRSCYATTGEKIILGFHIANFPMGSEIETKSRPGLEFNRYLTGYAIGTKPLIQAEIIRNGTVWKTIEIKEGKIDFEIDDTDRLSEIMLDPKEDGLPFAYYYLRVRQEDGHTAWSSPIWIETSRSENGRKSRKKTP